MFKSIFSKVQAFGKAVITRITAFAGGIIGIKPQIVEIPAPPEIANNSSNAPEAKTEEKEGLVKKVFKTVKKAASATIKTVKQALIVSAQIAYMVAHFAVPFQIISLAWEYAQAQGLVAIFIGLWNMGTIPYFILCIAILIGAGAAMITVVTLWSALLHPIRRFLFPIKQAKSVVEQVQPKENKEAEMAFYVIETVEKIVQRIENRLDERLVAIETMLKYDAPQAIAALEKSETEEVNTVVDSSPAAVITTSVPVAIEITDETDEIEETVDSSPVPPTNINHPLSMLFVLKDEQLTKELTELNMETLKKTIVALNSHVKAPQKVSSHSPKNAKKGEGKAILVNRIKQQIKMIRENNQMVAA